MSLPPLNPQSAGLGSLAQSARSKKLNQARGILIVIGVLTIILNVVFIAMGRHMVQEHIKKELQKQGLQAHLVNPVLLKAEEDRLLRLNMALWIVAAVLGAIFVLLGLIIKMFPVPATVIALVLYVGANAVFMALDPTTIAQGIIFKIIITVALVQAIVTAVAYQKEMAAVRDLEPEYE